MTTFGLVRSPVLAAPALRCVLTSNQRGDTSDAVCEFYNLVFMEFKKKDDGSLEPLKQKNIDTGLGLERMARILQEVPNNSKTLDQTNYEKAYEIGNMSLGCCIHPRGCPVGNACREVHRAYC
ncbi:hypothetical protein C1H46_018047 [Malus baccata]|uniref:Alanyl-tRNA synthetase class IIc N-terminal domain-containing protein n=1 Tax=Malus baccata TaxID=106549 RepID=A0A540MC28_MALBA|nr:hypothetical protein C1H46_018047 [Malus baccata]